MEINIIDFFKEKLFTNNPTLSNDEIEEWIKNNIYIDLIKDYATMYANIQLINLLDIVQDNITSIENLLLESNRNIHSDDYIELKSKIYGLKTTYNIIYNKLYNQYESI
jgi:hypothetical protein